MRRLAQPQVVVSAIVAAALSTALCAPRLLLWSKRPFPVWYLEATIFFGGFVLWAFVFAWHAEYTRRPFFTAKINSALFTGATLAGVLAAIGLRFLLDPSFRRITPEDYPPDLQHWIASVLFALAFTQLFLFYAPFAWLMRLFHNNQVALWLTVAFNVIVLLLKMHASPTPPPLSMVFGFLALRIAYAYFIVWFYLRGGILLVTWLGLLIEARHLLDFH